MLSNREARFDSSNGQASAPRESTLRRMWRVDAIDTGLAILFILALAWAPLWQGSDLPVAWGVNGIVFPSIALVYEAALLARGRPHPIGIRRIAVPVALFGLVVLWINVQMSPWVPASWQHPIWTMAGEILARPLAGSVSVNPDVTALALLRLSTAACAFWASMQLCRDSERAHLAIHAIVVIVALYAAYGLVAFAFLRGRILWFDFAEVDQVRSTFANKNTFATYAGLGLIAGVGLILRLYRREATGGGARLHRLARVVEVTAQSGWPLLAMTLVTLVALLGTISRGGLIAAALGLFALVALAFARDKKQGVGHFEAVLFLSVVVGVVFVAFGDLFAARLATEGFGEGARPAVYLLVIRSILDAPALGFGYGCFSDIFPMYRDRSIDTRYIWDMAHNTYLEVFLGLGLLFGSMLVLALAYIVKLCVDGALRRRRNATPAIVAAAAAVLVAFHALVDFSLQIEAVALTFMALLGAGVAQSLSSTESVSD